MYADEQAKERGLIFPARDIVQEYMRTMAVFAGSHIDVAAIFNETVGAIDYDDPTNIVAYADRVYARLESTVGKEYAAAVAAAVMRLAKDLSERYRKYGLYRNGRLSVYFVKMISMDMLLREYPQ